MDFIKGYSRFAKLPEPRMESVDWDVFLERLGNVVSFQIARSSPAQAAHFDTAQIEQVLINLVKNAHESGSPPEDVSLEVGVVDTGVRIRVCDRGSGMSDTVFRNALLPFYSTKRTGTGLGLPLCREVVESHGGRLNLANRRQGGLAVTIWLPDPPAGVGRAESG
jgi:signal transduction histidine kinase